jgi:hypothetical protein
MGMVGTGLSLIGGIEGLISGDAAKHRAEVAAQNAIRDYRGSASAEFQNLLAGGTAGLETLSGGLNHALTNTGRSLGASLAGAGVYNSTGAAGALANQAAANAGVEGQYSTNLANTLLGYKNQTDEHAAQMQYGLATNDLNYAREQQGGSVAGLSQLFGNLGQMNFGNVFGHNGGMTNTDPRATGSVLPPTNGIVQPIQNQWGGGGLGGGGAMTNGGILP